MAQKYQLENCYGWFNNKALKKFLSRKQAEMCCSRQDVYYYVAEKCNLSPNSVKRWDTSNSSPSDLGKVKDIANTLGIDYEDILIFEDAPEECSILEQRMEEKQMESKITYEEIIDDKIHLEINNIPIGADKKWFIRDIYIDLCKYISDVLYCDQIIRTENCPEHRCDPGYPIFLTRVKINRYRLDVPSDAIDAMMDLCDYLEKVPFYREICELEEFVGADATYEDVDNYYTNGMYMMADYYKFALSKGHNPVSLDDSERGKTWTILHEFYDLVISEFYKMAKERLGKYFD